MSYESQTNGAHDEPQSEADEAVDAGQPAETSAIGARDDANAPAWPANDQAPGRDDAAVGDAPRWNGHADDDSDAPIQLDGDTSALRDEGGDAVTSADVRADAVEIRNGGARDIDATSVAITQGGARDIDAQTVTITQGGAARIRADELNVSQGGVAVARADNLTIAEGGSAFAVMADSAQVDRDSNVFLLVAGSTSGDVRPVLDWKAAAALGAGFALASAAFRRIRRRPGSS